MPKMSNLHIFTFNTVYMSKGPKLIIICRRTENDKITILCYKFLFFSQLSCQGRYKLNSKLKVMPLICSKKQIISSTV